MYKNKNKEKGKLYKKGRGGKKKYQSLFVQDHH